MGWICFKLFLSTSYLSLVYLYGLLLHKLDSSFNTFDDHDFDLEVDPLVPEKGVQTVATMHSTVLPVQVTISHCLVHPLSKI